MNVFFQKYKTAQLFSKLIIIRKGYIVIKIISEGSCATECGIKILWLLLIAIVIQNINVFTVILNK